MLTKQERAAIAERIKSIGYVDEKTFYESIVGKCVPSTTSYSEDLKTIFRVVLDLCDTSNMMELPLDKDGEVIRIGDTVYDNDGKEYKVTGYRILFDDADIFLSNCSEPVYTTIFAHYLTHKQPVTIVTLVERIKNVMNDDSTTVWAYDELDDIVDQLKKLGDSDD